MNIWIFNHYAVAPDMPGATRHYDFAQELTKRGYNITIFASGFNYNLHKELKLVRGARWLIEKREGINFVWIKTFAYQENNWRRVFNMLFFAWRAYWFGRKITKINNDIYKPDIIIGSSVHLFAVLSAYCLSRYCEAKFIMEVRDLWPRTLVDMGKYKENDLMVKTLRYLEKFLYQRAQKIIVVLPQADEYITSSGIENSKIVWIPNGVNLTKFEKRKKEKSNNFFKVIYLGAHGRANALNIILDAAKIIQDKEFQKIKFLFIGDGTEKKNLIEYKNKLGLKNVVFCNSVPKTETCNALSRADIFLFNLKKLEVFKYGISSNKLFDYMAASKPIIFSVDAVNNPVQEAGCGLSVTPEKPRQMAEAIIRLYLLPPQEREKMGQRGREYVEKYHNIPILVDKLEKVIQNLC